MNTRDTSKLWEAVCLELGPLASICLILWFFSVPTEVCEKNHVSFFQNDGVQEIYERSTFFETSPEKASESTCTKVRNHVHFTHSIFTLLKSSENSRILEDHISTLSTEYPFIFKGTLPRWLYKNSTYELQIALKSSKY
jgi:hypothetical protein